MFPTRYGPIGVQICYDFWFNPELTRILALKGARLVVNCCATFKGEGKRDYMVHTTRTRAQENLIYTASANLLGGPGHQDYSAEHLDDAARRRLPRAQHHRGARVPALQHVYAEAGDSEEIVSATLSFEKLHRWQSIFPMREWRAGRQLDASQLIADEFTKLANP